MGKRGKKNKHIAQKKHALRRCYERLGYDLSEKEYQDALKSIQNGTASFKEKQSNRVSLFQLDIRGTEVLAAYDKERKTIITFMHLDPDPIAESIFGWTKHR